jgi:hypothetical protein
LAVGDGRNPKFRRRFGDTRVELDALEALHPGQLATIVEQRVRHYSDPTLSRRMFDARQAAHEAIEQEWDRQIGDLRDRAEQLVDSINERLSPYAEQIDALIADAGSLVADQLAELEMIARQIEETDIEVDLPEPAPPNAPPPPDDALYDSSRNWLDQLGRLRRATGVAA